MIVVINGREGPIQYFQMTTYKRQEGKWNSQPAITASLQLVKVNTGKSVDCSKASLEKKSIQENNENLIFKFRDEVWYKATNGSSAKTSSKSSETGSSIEKLSEIWKKQKYGSWIWAEINSSTSHLLTDLNYSLQTDSTYTGSAWRLRNCSQTYFPGSQELKWTSQQTISNFWNKDIQKLSKGEWVDTKEFCSYGHKRNVSKDKLKNLKLFCAKPITSP